jgi:hypothetical protein
LITFWPYFSTLRHQNEVKNYINQPDISLKFNLTRYWYNNYLLHQDTKTLPISSWSNFLSCPLTLHKCDSMLSIKNSNCMDMIKHQICKKTLKTQFKFNRLFTLDYKVNSLQIGCPTTRKHIENNKLDIMTYQIHYI